MVLNIVNGERLSDAMGKEKRSRTTGLNQKIIKPKQAGRIGKSKSKVLMSNSGPTNNELRE